MQVKGGALVAVRRNLRTKCGYSARRRAVKRKKALKGCGSGRQTKFV